MIDGDFFPTEVLTEDGVTQSPALRENKCNHLMELVWNHLGNIEGVSAYSEAMENWQIRNAITRSIHMLMRKMFYPERKIITVRQSASESSIRDIR